MSPFGVAHPLLLICLSWSITTSTATIARLRSHLLPENAGISDMELQEISTHVVPKVVKQLALAHERLRGPRFEVCPAAYDFTDQRRRAGCYLGRFVCDEKFTARCYWTFDRRCKCPQLWMLKIYECRISGMKVPTPKSPHGHVDIPIGECCIALWIWVAVAAGSVALLTFGAYKASRLVVKKLV